MAQIDWILPEWNGSTSQRCNPPMREAWRTQERDAKAGSPEVHRSERTDHRQPFQQPSGSSLGLHREIKVSHPRAQADIDLLVEANILHLLEGQRPKTYFSPEIMNIAYEEIEL